MNLEHLRAVVLDWAGTTVDHGSMAPVVALKRVFAANGVEITPAEARKDMGVLKKDQIRFILAGERVNLAWCAKHGNPPDEKDVEQMYTEFIPKQADVLAEFSAPIPGVCVSVPPPDIPASCWTRCNLPPRGKGTCRRRVLLPMKWARAGLHPICVTATQSCWECIPCGAA
jgi:hypothetical protein